MPEEVVEVSLEIGEVLDCGISLGMDDLVGGRRAFSWAAILDLRLE